MLTEAVRRDDVEALRRRVEDLERLHDLARIAAAPLDLDALLHLAVERTLSLLRSEVACLLLREGGGGLVERVAWGLDRATLEAVGGERSPVERVVLDDVGVIVPAIEKGIRVSLPAGREVRLSGLLGVPLRQAGRPVGALFVGNPESPYGEEALRLLEAAGDILALAISTARRLGRAAAEAEDLAALCDLGRLAAGAATPEEAVRYASHAAEALLALDRFALVSVGPGGAADPSGARIDIADVGRRLEAAVGADLDRDDPLPFRPHIVDEGGARRSLYVVPLAPVGEGLRVLIGTGTKVDSAEYDRRIRLLHLVAAQIGAALRAPAAGATAAGAAGSAAASSSRTERLAAIGELAAGIAHEVKNPLTSLKGFAELLPARLNDAAFVEKFGRVVVSEVARLDRLVGDLLSLARPTSGPSRRVDLGRLVEGVVDLVAPEARAAGIETRIDRSALPGDAALACDGDAESLRRAVLNLARNAIEAMRETGGRLTIRLRLEAGEALVEVADTGPGIPPDVRARLFDPFVSGKPGGTGLGLAISARIVEAAGGRIEARSVPGEGAVFVVRLPAVRAC